MILEPRGTGKYREEMVLRQPGYLGPFNPETGWELPNVSPTPGNSSPPSGWVQHKEYYPALLSGQRVVLESEVPRLPATPPPVSSGTLTHPHRKLPQCCLVPSCSYVLDIPTQMPG